MKKIYVAQFAKRIYYALLWNTIILITFWIPPPYFTSSFLTGAGAIYQIQNRTDRKENVVVGITTATSVWLSAAVGVACGGKLYFVASFTSFLVTLLLRFGPRHVESEDVEIVSSLTSSTRRRPPASLSVAVWLVRSGWTHHIIEYDWFVFPQHDLSTGLFRFKAFLIFDRSREKNHHNI